MILTEFAICKLGQLKILRLPVKDKPLIWLRRELLARMAVIPQMMRKLVTLMGGVSSRGHPLFVRRLLRVLLLLLPLLLLRVLL